jgi:hypothetical protein
MAHRPAGETDILIPTEGKIPAYAVRYTLSPFGLLSNARLAPAGNIEVPLSAAIKPLRFNMLAGP